MLDRTLSGRSVVDRLLTVAVWSSALAVSAVFLWLLGDLIAHGVGQLSWGFFVEAPRDAGRAGGIGPVLVSTAAILAVCLGTALPLGLGTALLLVEFTRHDDPLGRAVRRSLDVLAGVPSIVFGLFGNALFCIALGLGFSILSGGLTLACMVLPILIRSTEEGLRAVPQEMRLGAAALGMGRVRSLWHLLLPAAAPGLAVGIVLGFGRAIAETAALIFTSGYVARVPESLYDSGRSLSIHIYDLAINVPGGEGRAYATALVLVAILLFTNAVSGFLADRWLHRRLLVP